jgi:ribosomal protein S18 acetylase RimI-like enzyme
MEVEFLAEGMIRELDLDDYNELLKLWKRAGLHSLKPHGRDSVDALSRQLASGVQTILGVEIDGRLAGAVVATHDSRKGWINRLAVDPAYRRRGYGARLVRAAEEVLHDQGIRIIAALVECGNRKSLALFERCGYAVSSDIYYVSKRESDEI